MRQSDLDLAQKFLKRREFAKVIDTLDNPITSEMYRDVFEYYFYIATAYLYLGDIGNAGFFYQRARNIKITDSNLMLGQAAIFLRRGEIDRALKYYIDICDRDPENEVAKQAMEFIRTDGDFTTICKWADTGKLQKFYPPLGVNPKSITKMIFSSLLGIALACIILSVGERFFKESTAISGPRADLSTIVLNNYEKNSDDSIIESYENAMQYFQDRRDNACQVEINKILNSNALESIKNKASRLAELLDYSTISFDSPFDNYDIEQVSIHPELYANCFVCWSGRYVNDSISEDGSFSCNLLVGYENQNKVDGIVKLEFSDRPNLISDRSIVVLGRLETKENKLVMKVKSYYQPLRNNKNTND